MADCNDIETDPAAVLRLRLSRQPLTRLHLAAMLICTIGFAIDLSELALGNILSSIFSAPPHLMPSRTLSLLIAAPYVGAIGGAPLVGWLADRIGFRSTVTLAMLWLGLSSLGSAFAPSTLALIGARVLAGIGLGGFPPLMIAYMVDVAPARLKGLSVFLVCGLAYLAPPLVIFLARWLTPLAPLGVEGWRWPLAGAGLIAVAASFVAFRLPEAPGWLLSAGQFDRAASSIVRFEQSPPIFAAARQPAACHEPDKAVELVLVQAPLRVGLVRRFGALILLYISIPVATVAFPLLSGPALLARGISLSDTLFYVGMASFGPVIGTVLAAFFVDRIERRAGMAVCGALMLLAISTFFAARAAPILLGAVVSVGILTALYLPIMTTYGAELFEPEIRARSTAVAWSFNRLTAALAPLGLLPLVRSAQGSAIEAIIVLSLVLGILTCYLAPPIGFPGNGTQSR